MKYTIEEPGTSDTVFIEEAGECLRVQVEYAGEAGHYVDLDHEGAWGLLRAIAAATQRLRFDVEPPR